MPTLIVHGLSGTLPPLVNPAIARDYVYAEDVNDAYILAATHPGQEAGAVYNVGTGIQTSLSEVVDVARRTLSIEAEPQWGSMPDRTWDTSVWVADNRAVQAALGWRPRHSFEQGFRRMVDWFRDHPTLLRDYEARVLKVT
jgi:nucleoside-diphosphate-sugar epimerase